MSHTPHSTLNQRIAEAGELVTIGAVYKHYKYPDRDYQVLGFTIQESSQKVAVRYRNIRQSDAPEFVRDLDSWLETVEWEGETILRFRKARS